MSTPADPAGPLAGLLGADGASLALAAAVTLVPALAGAAIGFVAAGLSSRPLRRAAVLLAAALPLAAFGLPPGSVAGIGAWDLAWMGAWASAGGLAAGRIRAARVGRGDLVVGALGLLLALGILEGASRLLLPAPPSFPPPGEARLLGTLDHPGSLAFPRLAEGLFPDAFPGLLQQHRQQSEGARLRVLHLGDSVVRGSFVREDQAFPARLQALDPGAAHLNGGMEGTAVDFQYRMAREWVERLPLDAVVLYPYYNDIGEMDRPYAACGEGPVLDWDGDPPGDACPRAWARSPAEHPRLASPAPLALRVLTSWSFFARHACAAFARQAAPPFPGWDAAQRRFERALAALRDLLRARGIPLALVVPPSRVVVDQGPGSDGVKTSLDVLARFRDSAGRLGLVLLDPTPAFREAAAADPARRLFVDDPPGDPHLSVEGHDLMARWLLRELAVLDPPLAGPAAGAVTR